MEFKIGDEVVVKPGEEKNLHRKISMFLAAKGYNTKLYVMNVNTDQDVIYITHPEMNGTIGTMAHRWILASSTQKPEEVKTVATTTKEEKHKKSWSFHSTHPKDVDMHAIARDCTKKNPLLFIEHGDKKRVMVHKSLTIKAQTCGINMPDKGRGVHIFAYGESTMYSDIPSKFSEWVDWAKKVKVAKWPAETRNPCKVTVHIPTV